MAWAEPSCQKTQNFKNPEEYNSSDFHECFKKMLDILLMLTVSWYQ